GQGAQPDADHVDLRRPKRDPAEPDRLRDVARLRRQRRDPRRVRLQLPRRRLDVPAGGGEPGLRAHARPVPADHGHGAARHPGGRPGDGAARPADARLAVSAPAVTVEPAVRRRSPGANVWRAVRHDPKALVGAVLLAFFLVLALFPGQIAPDDPQAQEFLPGQGPSWQHWFGTTAYGQDVLSQLIWGTRQSVVIALLVGGLATALAVLVGVSAAYLGSIGDGVLSLITDVILVIPVFPLIIVFAAYKKNAGLFTLVVVLGLLGWSYGARQLRSQTLSLRRRDFLEAARVRGERKLYIILYEILPTMTSLIVATFLGAALYAVLFAAGLQFVGLGDPNGQSWGTMLYWAENNEALGAGMAWWAVMPGVCVALLGASFALLNYAFDEISNPALRKQPSQPAGVQPLARPPATSDALLEVRDLSVAYASDAGSVV